MEFDRARFFEKDKLQVHAGIYEGAPVLFVIGECDAYTVTALKDALDYAVEAGVKELIIDIRTTDFVDASGYNTLSYGRYKLEEIGGTMVLVDLTPPIERVINILGADALMTVVATLNQAVQHIRRYPLQPPKQA